MGSCRRNFIMAAVSRKILLNVNTLRPLVSGIQGRNIHFAAPALAAAPAKAPVSKPQGRTSAVLIPGDGVHPELCMVVQDVFKAAGVPLDFKEHYFSEVTSRSDTVEDVAKSIRSSGICLKGINASPDYSSEGEAKTLNMKLRDELDLYANVVHAASRDGMKTRHKNVDMVVIREQTEGEYSAIEHESVKGVVECLKITTEFKTRRIAKFAFDYATKNNRKKVTAVHKANIMKLGDGLFLKSCTEVAKLYPNIQFDNMIVDNCTMQMASKPQQFDVLVMPNLYGNIIDNLAAGLVGGAGVVAGASYSSEVAIFEPGARHTYSEATGKNVANPTAMLLCAANMLNHINLQYHGDIIRNAIDRVIKAGKVKTHDMGGYSTTMQYKQAIINSIKF